MRMDEFRLLVGLATTYDVPARDDGSRWSAEEFKDFVDAELTVPLMLNHEPIINSWGITPSVGTVRRFASVEYPVKGLLCLAEVGAADGWGDSILRDVGKALSQEYLPSAWGMSVRASNIEARQWWLTEVSITRRPAYSDAKILGIGPDALDIWQLCIDVNAASAKAT